jgi:hypothetical protein
LSAIEFEIDASLRVRLAHMAGEQDAGSEAAVLIAATHRLDNLVQHRRIILASARVADPEIAIADLFAGAGDEATVSRTDKLPVV